MTKRYTKWFWLSGLGPVLASSSPVAAQALADTNPPLPNVLLLMDTSGSMERKSGTQDLPQCDPTGGVPSERSRWIEAVEVLTGSINGYRCYAQSRSSQGFRDEYSLDGNPPYDLNYVLPYHRPLSNTCTPAPGVLPANAYAYPVGAVRYRPYDNLLGSCLDFTQASDGVLDTFSSFIRFGLMTFDTLPNAGTGVSGTTPQYASGIAGTWSYFLGGAAAAGRPEQCLELLDMEVGARNAAAPPWEGRMVTFGDPNADANAVLGRNAQIQEILLSTRPFGATPIAGMLKDAKDFLWNDTTDDPLNPALKFGPATDTYILNGCREQALILLTDGEPNLDLRPACEGTLPPSGVCPFEQPWQTAGELANSVAPDRRPAKTYVVGFALDEVTVGAQTKNCRDLTEAELTAPDGLCAQNPDNVRLQACCTLSRVAFEGGTGRAYFANNQDDLALALSQILGNFSTTTTRTRPSFSEAGVSSDSAGFRFFSSFEPRPLSLSAQLPQGVLERQRYTCNDLSNPGKPVALPIDPEKGDDFAANLNATSPATRWLSSVEVEASMGSVFSGRSVRPGVSGNPDGLGSFTGTQYTNTASDFVSNTPPAAMGLTAGIGDCVGLTATQCRDRLMRWQVGLDNGTEFHRCPTPGTNCFLMGGILHSTPKVVNRPLSFLRDESYQAFAASKATRPVALYVSTNDGFLHAFKVARNTTSDSEVNTKDRNELWAFIPPAVLPLIQGQYPPAYQKLLNGAAVVKDVVAKLEGSTYKFERSLHDARAGSGAWRTVLVQSFGPGAAVSGYFAVDITDPVVTNTTGPKFLWQLTQDGTGAPLFGSSPGTPLITTVFIDDGLAPKEVPVAVLPGGDGSSAGTCPRGDTPSGIDPDFTARTDVRCYAGSQPGRSLTIVRLDSGQIIKTFRKVAADGPAGLDAAGVLVPTPLDAPLVGEPVAYPAVAGAVADRIFVGDKEGGLWKLDLSSSNPADWTMKLFFDAFPQGTLSHAAADSQPIINAPVLSVDERGNLVIIVSTGDQEIFTYTAGVKNYVWSLTEKPNDDATAFEAQVNWYQTLENGERVTGDITLFNRNLFFSSFLPDSGAGGSCALGNAYVWGMDYLLPDTTNGAGSGGRDALPLPNTNPLEIADKLDVSATLGTTRASIFGIGVAQEPTCFDEETTTGDTFLGFGSHTSVSNVNPGKFQLVLQTGASGTAVDGGRTNTVAIDLPTPALTSRIDSWAALVE